MRQHIAKQTGERPHPRPVDWSWLVPRRRGVIAAVVVGASATAIISWRMGWSPWLPAYLFFVFVGGLIALGDLYTRRVPNRLVLPAVAFQTLLFALAAISLARWATFGRLVLAGFLLAAFFAVFALMSSMGAGDVKFALLVGEVLGAVGWATLFLGALSGLVLAFASGWLAIASGRANCRTLIPFAPALYLGAIVVVCCTVR